jgi:hypothetical protein
MANENFASVQRCFVRNFSTTSSAPSSPADLRCPVEELAPGPSTVEGRKQARPASRHTPPMSMSLFPLRPRPRPLRVLPHPAFAFGTATPYGLATEQRTTPPHVAGQVGPCALRPNHGRCWCEPQTNERAPRRPAWRAQPTAPSAVVVAAWPAPAPRPRRGRRPPGRTALDHHRQRSHRPRGGVTWPPCESCC